MSLLNQFCRTDRAVILFLKDTLLPSRNILFIGNIMTSYCYLTTLSLFSTISCNPLQIFGKFQRQNSKNILNLAQLKNIAPLMRKKLQESNQHAFNIGSTRSLATSYFHIKRYEGILITHTKPSAKIQIQPSAPRSLLFSFQDFSAH